MKLLFQFRAAPLLVVHEMFSCGIKYDSVDATFIIDAMRFWFAIKAWFTGNEIRPDIYPDEKWFTQQPVVVFMHVKMHLIPCGNSTIEPHEPGFKSSSYYYFLPNLDSMMELSVQWYTTSINLTKSSFVDQFTHRFQVWIPVSIGSV